MHTGEIYKGKRYKALLLGLGPKAKVEIYRLDASYEESRPAYAVERTYGFLNWSTHSVVEMCEKAISLIREHDAVLETFPTTEEEEEATCTSNK